MEETDGLATGLLRDSDVVCQRHGLDSDTMFETNHPAAAYVPIDRAGARELRVGFDWVLEWSAKNGGTPLLITPTRRNADFDPVLRRLASTMRWETTQTIHRGDYWAGGGVLAVWLGLRELEDLDDDSRVQALCVVPWLVRDIDAWIVARRPTNLLQPEEEPERLVLQDGVLGAALLSLSNAVNLGTALADPDDKEETIRTLQALLAGGHSWSPEELYRWAYSHGWSAKGARSLKELAAGILAGKRYRLSAASVADGDRLLAYFRSRAESSAGDKT